ncbi:MAG: hypothetical protein JJE21_09630 [Spirochaetaceae bacterium]|nr:hypothetical protein [Spirochaetaceae bacterium]
MKDEDKKVEEEVVEEVMLQQVAQEEVNSDDVTPEATILNDNERIKDDPTATVYERPAMSKKKYEDGRNVALVLGILAIVSSTTLCLVLFGLILGIIAIVKGAKVRKTSSAGLAGWLLGIISVVLSSAKIIAGLTIISHFAMYNSRYMDHAYRMWF